MINTKHQIKGYTVRQLFTVIAILSIIAGLSVAQYNKHSKKSVLSKVDHYLGSVKNQILSSLADNNQMPTEEVISSIPIPEMVSPVFYTPSIDTLTTVDKQAIKDYFISYIPDEANFIATQLDLAVGKSKILGVGKNTYSKDEHVLSEISVFGTTPTSYMITYIAPDNSYKIITLKNFHTMNCGKTNNSHWDLSKRRCVCTDPSLFLNAIGECVSCPDGKFISGGACRSCNLANSNGCDSKTGKPNCVSGYILDHTTTPASCVACPADTPYGDGSSCLACPSITPYWDGKNCAACPKSNMYWNGSKCVNCANSVGNNPTVLKCDNNGNPTVCNAGYELHNGTDPKTCVACRSGTFAASGANLCQSCELTNALGCDPKRGIPDCKPGYRRSKLQGNDSFPQWRCLPKEIEQPVLTVDSTAAACPNGSTNTGLGGSVDNTDNCYCEAPNQAWIAQHDNPATCNRVSCPDGSSTRGLGGPTSQKGCFCDDYHEVWWKEPLKGYGCYRCPGWDASYHGAGSPDSHISDCKCNNRNASWYYKSNPGRADWHITMNCGFCPGGSGPYTINTGGAVPALHCYCEDGVVVYRDTVDQSTISLHDKCRSLCKSVGSSYFRFIFWGLKNVPQSCKCPANTNWNYSLGQCE